MQILNVRRPSYELRSLYNAGYVMLFDGTKPASLPEKLVFTDDFGTIDIGQPVGMYQLSTNNEMDVYNYFGKPKDFIQHNLTSLGCGSAQYLAPGEIGGVINQEADYDRWIVTPNKVKGAYPYATAQEILGPMMALQGIGNIRMMSRFVEGREQCYFEFPEEVTIHEIHWAMSAASYARAYYPIIEVWNFDTEQWEKYTGTAGSTGTSGSSISIYDSDLMYSDGAIRAKDLSENPLVGKRFKLTSDHTHDRYFDSRWTFVTKTDPVNLPKKMTPTWGVHIDKDYRILQMFDASIGTDSSGEFHIKAPLENSKKLEVIQYKFYIPSFASPLEKEMSDAGIAPFDSPSSKGWARIGFFDKVPNVANWATLRDNMQYGIKIVDEEFNTVMAWVHKDELIKGPDFTINDVANLIPGNNPGGNEDAIYLYQRDDEGSDRRIVIDGTGIGVHMTLKKGSIERAFDHGAAWGYKWAIYIDSPVPAVPYDPASLSGPANIVFDDQQIWTDGGWPMITDLHGSMTDGVTNNYGGAVNIQLHPSTAYVDFTLDSDTGMELMTHTTGTVTLIRLSDNAESHLNVTTQQAKVFNIPAGSYRMRTEDNIIVSEFRPTVEHAGYPQITFAQPPSIGPTMHSTYGHPTKPSGAVGTEATFALGATLTGQYITYSIDAGNVLTVNVTAGSFGSSAGVFDGVHIHGFGGLTSATVLTGAGNVHEVTHDSEQVWLALTGGSGDTITIQLGF